MFIYNRNCTTAAHKNEQSQQKAIITDYRGQITIKALSTLSLIIMSFGTMYLVLIRDRYLRQKWLLMGGKWDKFIDNDEEGSDETLLSLTSLSHNQSCPDNK